MAGGARSKNIAEQSAIQSQGARADRGCASPDDPRSDPHAGAALAIWLRSQAASGTAVETYLRHRGYTGPIPPSLRFANGRVAFYQVPPASLPLYLDVGLRVMKIGEEACVALPKFTLEGSGNAGLRYFLRRGERDGLALEIVPSAGIADVIDELEVISDA
jgi:hypothetical protein